MITFSVPTDLAHNRLDTAILSLLPEGITSRVKVQHFIENQQVLVNEKIITKCSHRLSEGDSIVMPEIETPLFVSDHVPLAENISLEILFENDDMLVINKPAGMVTHPDEHYHSGTVVNAVLGYFQSKGIESTAPRAGIVHRLDKDTSGCLMVAKTESMHRYLSSIIAERKITKKYTAVLSGTLSADKGTIDAPLSRDPNNRERMIPMDTKTAKSAVTHFDVLERYHNPSLTLVSVHIITGRTHQIRAHFRSIGFPVIHDVLYGNGLDYGCPRMFLHASFLEFPLPNGTVQQVSCPLPDDLESFLETKRNAV